MLSASALAYTSSEPQPRLHSTQPKGPPNPDPNPNLTLGCIQPNPSGLLEQHLLFFRKLFAFHKAFVKGIQSVLQTDETQGLLGIVLGSELGAKLGLA